MRRFITEIKKLDWEFWLFVGGGIVLFLVGCILYSD